MENMSIVVRHAENTCVSLCELQPLQTDTLQAEALLSKQDLKLLEAADQIPPRPSASYQTEAPVRLPAE